MHANHLHSPRGQGSLSLLAGALLLASSAAFASVETAKVPSHRQGPAAGQDLHRQQRTHRALALAKPTITDCP